MRSACGSSGLGVVVALGLLAQAPRALAQTSSLAEPGFPAPPSVVQGSGARALGMGGAFLARADDATAVSWNPAGLSYLSRPEICVVGTQRGFEQSTTDPNGAALYQEEFHGTSPDFVSGAWPLRVGSTSGSLQIAYQRVLGFEGDSEWSKVVTGSTSTIDFTAQSTGGFDTISMAAGFRVARPLRVGLVVNRWFNGFDERRERLGRRSSVQDDSFDLSGWNVNFGLIVHPVENVNVGFVYKWAFRGDVELSRSRTDSVEPDPPVVSAANGMSQLDFPAAIGVGLSWRLTSPLTVSADFTRSYWSKGRIYDYFDLGKTPTVYDELLYPTLVTAPAQVDSDQWRVGVEYVLVGRHLSVPLRTGYYSDRQYFVDAEGAAPRYDGITFGAGIIVRGVLLDFAYVRQRGHYPDPDWVLSSGRAEVKTHQIYASMIFRFGGN